MRRNVKWTAFLVAFVLVFALHVKATPLKDRAIVVALGIDLEGEKITVSAEVLRPSDDESKSAGYIMVSSEASTISEALGNVTKQTASLGALSHCDLVVLGAGVAERDAYGTIDYVFRNAYLSENAIVMTTNKTAKELLGAKTPYSDTGAFYVEQANETYGKSCWLVRRNVKDYVASYYTHNGGNWLTEVTKKETEKPKTTDSTSSSGGGEQEKEYAFFYHTTAVFIKNKKVMTLGEDGTFGINLVGAKLDRGAVTVKSADGAVYSFYVASSECKREFVPDSLRATFKLKTRLVLKEILSDGGAPLYTPDVEPDEGVKDLVKQKLVSYVQTAFESTRAVGADVFDLYGGFYGKSRDEGAIPADYLSATKLTVKAEVSYI